MSFFRQHKILLISLFLLLMVSFLLFWFLIVPPSGTSSNRMLTVKRGMSFRSIAAMLEKEGIIRNKDLFIIMATLLQKTGTIKAGEYEFPPKMSSLKVLDTLIKGQVKQHLITVPEGYTLSQIAQLLEDSGIVNKSAFLQKVSSPSFIASLGLSDHLLMPSRPPSKQDGSLTLEGYLFPDTYHLIKEMEPEEVIRIMVQQFQKTFGPELIERASQLRMHPFEVVTLASIIEKETSLPEEKPLISAVFHNRLKIRMPLQSDPTVIYGIKNFDGNLTKEHLLKSTPYNTYLFGGLPPTPICNPGKASIQAALYPASVPYLYFVSKNDGSHHFSTNLEEHQRAVAKFQKNPLEKK